MILTDYVHAMSVVTDAMFNVDFDLTSNQH